MYPQGRRQQCFLSEARSGRNPSSETQGQIVGRAGNWGERKTTADGEGAPRSAPGPPRMEGAVRRGLGREGDWEEPSPSCTPASPSQHFFFWRLCPTIPCVPCLFGPHLVPISSREFDVRLSHSGGIEPTFIEAHVGDRVWLNCTADQVKRLLLQQELARPIILAGSSWMCR